MDKNNINNLEKQIKERNLEAFHNNYHPTENPYRIGPVSSLNFLIESTYFTLDKQNDIKEFDTNALNPYIYKFRNILGDGDCFYRGLIFSLLENIILSNNIMQMKELLILYYEKINKNNKLIKEKEYLQEINKLNISIVSEILYILITQMENDISKAYETLLKVFLFCKNFDDSIIYFVRYLFYEYISANEDKVYSKEYEIELGCLLPEEYMADNGKKNDYLFENFYSLYLMYPKSFAEKIVIYIAPFVFDINLNILIYDFGNNETKSIIQEKKFFNEKENKSKIEINLVFRKSHYDIFYRKKFYEEYQKYLDFLLNKNENILFVNNYQINDNKNEKKDDKFENNNKNENKNDKFENNNDKNEKKNDKNENINDKNENNIDKNEKNSNINENANSNQNKNENNENKINEPENKCENKPENNNEKNMPICLECKKPYSKENVFFLCDECTFNNLKTVLFSSYLEFLKDINNLINSKEKLNKYLLERNCTISPVQENIPILNAIYNSNYKFDEILFSIRKEICLFCGLNLKSENEYLLELPCKCRICSYNCLNLYIKNIKYFITLKKSNDPNCYKTVNILSCFCGYKYITKDVLYMIKQMENFQLKSEKEIYQNYIINYWNWRCMKCLKDFRMDEQFFRLFFNCENIDKTLLKSNTEFKHLLCGNCYFNNNNMFNMQQIIVCEICNLEHKIVELKQVNRCNQEES